MHVFKMIKFKIPINQTIQGLKKLKIDDEIFAFFPIYPNQVDQELLLLMNALELSCSNYYTVKTMLPNERQSNISIMQPYKRKIGRYFLYLFSCFAGANEPGKYCHLTTC